MTDGLGVDGGDELGVDGGDELPGPKVIKPLGVTIIFVSTVGVGDDVAKLLIEGIFELNEKLSEGEEFGPLRSVMFIIAAVGSELDNGLSEKSIDGPSNAAPAVSMSICLLVRRV
jgi:hypothetical protein